MAESPRDELARRYAPIVVIHPDDPWKPADPALFIKGCELRYANKGAVTSVAGSGSVDPARLGVASGLQAYQSASSDVGRPVSAWEFTRPYSKPTARLAGLDEASGFSLARVTPLEPIPLASAPMLYEWRDDSTLIYWFFSDGSSLPQNFVEAIRELLGIGNSEELAQARALLDGIELLTEIHQGDWEGMTFTFNGVTPISVELHQHGALVWTPLDTLERDHDRVIVYSGLGSHSTVGSPDAAGEEVVDKNGPAWRPSEILDAQSQPWYSFGGAWGETLLAPVGRIPSSVRELIMALTARQRRIDVWEEATGPLGPSRWKTS